MQVCTEENLQDVGLSQQFLDLTPKAQSNIEKTGKLDLMKNFFNIVIGI